MKKNWEKGLPTVHRGSLIQITGSDELLAEGCGEVRLYDENKIIFRTKRRIIIEGRQLVMTNLDSGAVSVKGKIALIKFED